MNSTRNPAEPVYEHLLCLIRWWLDHLNSGLTWHNQQAHLAEYDKETSRASCRCLSYAFASQITFISHLSGVIRKGKGMTLFPPWSWCCWLKVDWLPNRRLRCFIPRRALSSQHLEEFPRPSLCSWVCWGYSNGVTLKSKAMRRAPGPGLLCHV